MFAVIKTGGKQYRVAAEDVIRVDRVNGQPGEIVEFGEVLVVGGDAPQLGTPIVAGATVAPASAGVWLRATSDRLRREHPASLTEDAVELRI